MQSCRALLGGQTNIMLIPRGKCMKCIVVNCVMLCASNIYHSSAIHHRSLCLKDCEPGASAGCTRVTNPSAKLYPDLSTCCSEGLPWASTEFCNTRSVEQTSNKWFASKDHLCRQDCTSGATCANLTDSTETLYDSALDCCEIISHP